MPELLSVIVPIYNEERTVAEIVRRIEAVDVPKEVLLVDDGSTDGTVRIIEAELLPVFSNVRLYRHPRNAGKGMAIRTGLEHARGDFLIIQDADLEYDPADYLAICRELEKLDVHVVYGTRFKNIRRLEFIRRWFCNRFLRGRYEISYLHHFLGIQVLNFLANILYSANITDEATCYKAFKREVLEKIHLESRGFEFCPEVTAKVRKAGYAITEVPISYHPRSRSEGKKLNWRHGFGAVFTLIQYRFVD